MPTPSPQNTGISDLLASPFAMLGVGLGAPLDVDQESDKPIGDQIYDAIMADIDPRLTTENIDNFSAKDTLTPEEAASIKESFAEYDARYAGFKTALMEGEKAEKRQRMKLLEDSDRANESQKMGRLQDDISQAA